MQVLSSLALAAVLATSVTGRYTLPPNEEAALRLLARALPNSPEGYTPSDVSCPSNRPSVRSAATLSPNETSWLELRRNNTVDPMRDLLGRVNIEGFDVNGFMDRVSSNASELPNIGLAFSGGGWRAMLNGAGAVKAWDDRTENATAPGRLGGLLQASTYVAGLSGGSWLVGSIYVNNFTTVTDLQADTSGSVWEFSQSVVEGPSSDGIQLFSTVDYYGQINSAIQGKRDAGYDASITDIWGRALSYQLINATDGGPAYTWSSIALNQEFQRANQPFPIVIADARAPGERIISLNASVYEFNPFEMGTWDPTAFGFVPTQYLGTNMTNGSVTDDGSCVVGFDNAGFVMGTSSSLFNQILLNLNSTGIDLPESILSLIQGALQGLDEDDNDIADYSPNPFFGYRSGENPNAEQQRLTLVDGGEDLQNIPFHPLIQPERHLDVIFAIDSSADTPTTWPNGTSMVATYERTAGDIANGTGFPSVPSQNTFVNLGLNTRPTFFGCDPNNMTDGLNVPLVVYIPNAPYVAYSNVTTFTLSYSEPFPHLPFQPHCSSPMLRSPSLDNTYRDAIIANGYDVATMGNASVDSTWPTCVGCAIISRSLDRQGSDVPEVCRTCFQNLCWDGTVNDTTPNEYQPTLRLEDQALDVQSSGGVEMGRSLVGVAALAVLVAALLI
jgi:lysophospholipase